ncbi:hypothetical protein D3C81_1488620 [compost metagenome]
MLGEFGPGQLLALTVLRHADHRHGIVTPPQQVFGEVQRGAGKPLGVGHLRAFAQHGIGLRVEADIEEIDNRLPEFRALLDAPLVQGRVIVEFQ